MKFWEYENFCNGERYILSEDHGLSDGAMIQFVDKEGLPLGIVADVEYQVEYITDYCFSVWRRIQNPDKIVYGKVPMYEEALGDFEYFVPGGELVQCQFVQNIELVRDNDVLIECNTSSTESNREIFKGKSGIKVIRGNSTNAMYPPDTKVSETNESINEYEEFTNADDEQELRVKNNLGKNNHTKMTKIERRNIMADERITNKIIRKDYKHEIEKAKADIKEENNNG